MDLLASRHARDRHLTERLTQQAAFARALAARHAEARAGTDLADRAEALFRQAAADGGDLQAALTQAEVILAPLAPLAKSYTIHCAGHGHIDMNWQWPWEETVATTADTFRTVLKLMDEFPGFIFSQSQVAIYAFIRDYHPQLFAQIRARIREGRWEVTAAHWVEGDRNIASGESLARQLLLSRAFCHEHLDLSPEDVAIDWVPDCFGHAATLPAIDSAGAVRHYYCWRTGRTDRPAVFRWRAPDGVEVVVSRELNSYNGSPEGDVWKHLFRIEETCGLRDWQLVYGVGDHGGGPTRRQLRRIVDQDSWPVFPRWRFATVKSWFALLDGVRGRLPVVSEELNTEYTGCMTSQASIKRNNRRGENACADADTAGALARLLAATAPRRDLTIGAWRDVCFGQFHDILPGSGVRATREYSGGQQQRILAATTAASTEALRAVAGHIDLSFVGVSTASGTIDACGSGSGWGAGSLYGGSPVDGWPAGVVWFNPLATARDEVVTLRVWEGEGWQFTAPQRAFRLRRADGTLIPAQRLGHGTYWGHQWVDLAVPVCAGALGWNSAAVEEGDAPPVAAPARAIRDEEGGKNHPPAVCLPSGRLALENGLLSVEFDHTSGTVKSLRDAAGREFATGVGFAGLRVTTERPHPMSSWIIGDAMRTDDPLCESLEVVQWGPQLASIQAKLRYADSTMTVTYSLAAGSPRLAVTVETRWLERGGHQRVPPHGTPRGIPRLSIRFPTVLAGATPRYEIPFGSITRDLQPGRIVPSQRWATLSTPGGSCTVANDGAYGHSTDGGCLTIDLVRSSYDPDPLPDLGDHRWSFTVRPWDGEPAVAAQIDEGRMLNQPLRALLTAGHPGELPSDSGELLRCEPASVQITQIKAAEDGDGLIVRLQETAGAVATPVLRLRGDVVATTSTDLLERPLAGSTAIAAYGIASLRIRPGSSGC
jgi:alpha-mannosidase